MSPRGNAPAGEADQDFTRARRRVAKPKPCRVAPASRSPCRRRQRSSRTADNPPVATRASERAYTSGIENALLIRDLDLRVVEFRVPLHESDPRRGVRAEVQVAECRDLIAWPGVDLNGRTVLVPNI